MNIDVIFKFLSNHWTELIVLIPAVGALFWKILKWIWDKCFTSPSKTKEWRSDYIYNKLFRDFPKYISEEINDLYVPTRFQEERPNIDVVPEKGAKNPTRKELIPYFLDTVFVKNNPYRFYCVLADTGMGKTTFLVQLLKAYINKYDEKSLPFNIFILDLANIDIIEQINNLQIDPNKGSILMLDALDENVEAYDKEDENGIIISRYEDFRKKLEQAVERFQFVVITCRTQFFPDKKSELQELKNARHIGQSPDKSLPRFKQLYISPFSEDEINRYIEKKFKNDVESKEKAKSIIDDIKYLAARPLILSYIDDLMDGKIKNVLDAYEIIIDKWLQREVIRTAEDNRNRQKKLLYDFSRKLAVYIYEKWENTGALYLTQEEYDEFKKKNQSFNGLELSVDNKSLITRDNRRNIIFFAHKSFIEYFCAEQLFMGEISVFYFAEMNMAKTFFELFCQTKEDKLDLPGESDIDKARRYDAIGQVFRYSIGDYDKALEYYRKALKVREEVLGYEHPDTAMSYNNIGYVYWIKGMNDEALRYLNMAKDIREKILEPDHPDTATSYNNIGLIYRAKEEYDEALMYHNMALEIRERVLGQEHPDTAMSYNNIGYVYRNKNELDKALKYYKIALDIREKVLGPRHPDTAMTYKNIGNVYRVKGEYDEALRYLMKDLAISERVLGLDHPDTATSYHDIGHLYLEKGKNDKALEYLNKAKDNREKIFGPKHPRTRYTYSLIGEVYKKMGNTDEAQKWYDKAGE
jgi:tetratricopeptide (TPR) repeat protein